MLMMLDQVPALKDRLEDVPLLIEHFNEQIATEYGSMKKLIKPDAIKELQKMEWTGNIREFRNVVERLFILCETEITGKDVRAFSAPLSN